MTDPTRLAFVIPGPPVPWARARRKGKQYFTAPKQEAAKHRVRAAAHNAARKAGWELTTKAVGISIHIVARRERVSRPDLDNYAKLVLDAIQGILIKDDCQAVKLFVGKCDARDYQGEEARERTEVEIWLR